MTAMISTPHIELIDCLIAADLEVARLLDRLRGLGRRLIGARRHLDRPDARLNLGRAYLYQVEGEYAEVLGELRDARREALALIRVD